MLSFRGFLRSAAAIAVAFTAAFTAAFTGSVEAQSRNPKVAPDLHAVVTAPTASPISDANVTWARKVNGALFVRVLIVAKQDDRTLSNLRSFITAGDGTGQGAVIYNYASVRALSAMVPSTMVATLAARADVVSITPNRPLKTASSLVQGTTGADTVLPTSAGGSATAGALTGAGVGIAILDSGIDFRHRNFTAVDSKGKSYSRVKYAIDFVSIGPNLEQGGCKPGKD